MTTNQSNIRKGWRGIWKEYPQGYDNLNIQNVMSYGAEGNGVTIDTSAWQQAIDAIPQNGGVLYAPPVGYFEIDGTLTLSGKKSVILLGAESPNVDASINASNMPGALRVSSTSWGTTTPMLLITAPDSGNQESKGGVLLSGLGFFAGRGGAGSGGYGIQVLKNGADTGFWGDISLNGCTIISANRGLYFYDLAGSGFGWIKVFQSRIQGCNYGISANCQLNDVSIIDSIIRQNKQASNSSYLSRTGGAIVLTSVAKATIHGNDFEGSQVGVQITTADNVDIRSNYFETMYDCSVAINGATDVTIENNYMLDNNRTRQIFVRSSKRVTQRNNSNSYIICDLNNRDIVTDTPSLTRFTTTQNDAGTAGSQTLDDYGFWIQSIPSPQPSVQASRVSHYPVQTISLTNAAFEAVTIAGPGGVTGKLLGINPSSNFGGASFNWLSSALTVVEGQWVVISVQVFSPTANAATDTLYVEVNEQMNGTGTPVLVFSGTIPDAQFTKGEWVTFQWFHKVLNGQTTYTGNIKIACPSAADTLVVGSVTLNIVDQPAITPMQGVVSAEANASEFQYFLGDGFGRYYSSAVFASAKPTGSLLTWYDGEQITTTSTVSATEPGYIVTVSGTGGGTAKFAAMAALAAEAT